jgi:hypothetical protein
MRLAKWLLLLSVLLCAPFAQASFVQKIDYQAVASSGSMTFASNNTAGNTLVVILAVYNTTSCPTISLNSFSDSEGNAYVKSWSYVKYPNTTSTHCGSLFVFEAPNCKAGANTVSWAVSTGGTFLAIGLEYSGLATYSVGGFSANFSNSAASVSSGNVIATSGDTLFAGAVNTNSSTTSFTVPGGYTSRDQINTTFEGINVYDSTAGSTGATSATATIGTSTGGLWSFILDLRVSTPTFGRVQTAPFTTSTSEAYLQPNLTGDMLVALCRAAGSFQNASDSNGNTWTALPLLGEGDAGDYWALNYAVNSNSGANTVTCSGGNGMALWEFSGVDTVAPLAGTSAGFSGATGSSFASGSVVVPGSSILFSTGFSSGTAGLLFSPSLTMDPSLFFNSTDSFQAWDSTVAAGTYANTCTFSGSGLYPQCGLLAFSTSTIGYSVLRQHTRVGLPTGSDGTVSQLFLSNVKSGDLILAVVANQTTGSSPGTMSDSPQGNTYHLIVGGSNGYGVYWTKATATGALTVSNTFGNCLGISEFTIPAGLTLDQSNTAVNASATSLASGNITTVAGTKLMIATGSIINTTSRLYFSSMNSGWSQEVLSCGGHYAAFFLGFQSQVTPGTYSNTFTWTGAASPVSSSIMSFSIPSSGGQPVVNIISKSVKPERFEPGVLMQARLSAEALATE